MCLPQTGCRLNCMSFGDNRRQQLKLCRGYLCLLSFGLWSLTCLGALPKRSTDSEDKIMVKPSGVKPSGVIIAAFVFCLRHCPKKQWSQTLTALLLDASLRTRWSGFIFGLQELADLQMCKGEGGESSKDSGNVHLRIRWRRCCLLNFPKQ